MRKNNSSEEQNFWVSYADLMAGLLFVFILIVGAIVLKSALMRQDLQEVQSSLEQESSALKEMAQKMRSLELIRDDLNTTLSLTYGDLELKKDELRLTQKEVDTLKDILLDKESDAVKMLSIIDVLSSDLNATKNRAIELADSFEELKIERQRDRDEIVLKSAELAQLQKRFLLNQQEYQKVVEDLNLTRLKIKNLTGIKVKVVQHLKDKLGKNMVIDPKSGTLRLSSNILFNQGESTLKPEAKKELKEMLGQYINTLLMDEAIAKHIELITIEGYTNSDGAYLYNLKLSQKRAFNVMEFLYKQFPQNEMLFRRYLSASGRASSNLIFKANVEDKDASRRIEIRFSIKNEDQLKELMGYIESAK